MTTEITDASNDLTFEEFLKAERDWTESFAATAATQSGRNWKDFAKSARSWKATRFLNPIIYALEDWQETLYPGSKLERYSPDPEDEGIHWDADDPILDPSYEEHWSPSMLYRW